MHNIDLLHLTTSTLLCIVAILFAHGTLQEMAGWRTTWRLTDSAMGRLWLSFAVVLVMSMPTLATLPVWLYLLTWLVFSVAFYVGMDRYVLQPIPHEVRRVTAASGVSRTWVDNHEPRGYRWYDWRVLAIG